MQVAANYPGDAARGADFLTGAAQRVIADPSRSPEDGGLRRERVIITDHYIEHEGRVCLSETSVQHMANLLGMYEGERVERIIAENDALRGEVAAQQAEVAALQNRIAGLDQPRTIYISADGKEYQTSGGAAAASVTIEAPQVVAAPGDENAAGGASASPPEEGTPDPPAAPKKARAKKAAPKKATE